MEARPLLPALLAALAFGTGAMAQQGKPLSVIDWLSDSVGNDPAKLGPPEPGVTEGAAIEEITVTPLGEVSSDAVGLLPVSVTGLPADLWGTTSSEALAELFARVSDEGRLLPAMQELLLTLLLAELDPPADTDPSQALFLARIDTLMTMGAVEQARALLERAGPDAPQTFRRYFDASLLTGTEDRACQVLRAAPDLAPDLAARVFCLARNGDWNAAALTLETGQALGALTGAENAILARYLDPETFAGTPELAPPPRPSALVFRLYEAVGEPIPSTLLPLPYAQADLRLNAGWKAQIEAAERLARSGVIDANRLLGLYTDRKPAASGGVWGRVAAIQRFEAALAAGDGPALSDALALAWAALGEVSLQTVFAELYADRLREAPLTGDARRLGFEIGLLSEHYEAVALAHEPADARERFLKAVARGDLTGVQPPDDTAAAIAAGFRSASPPDRLRALVADGNLGEALLRAIRLGSDGAHGDIEKLRDAIALLRSVGLEDTARRFALQVMILVEDA